eukprot:7294961-Prymnesium_polylepis.1
MCRLSRKSSSGSLCRSATPCSQARTRRSWCSPTSVTCTTTWRDTAMGPSCANCRQACAIGQDPLPYANSHGALVRDMTRGLRDRPRPPPMHKQPWKPRARYDARPAR